MSKLSGRAPHLETDPTGSGWLSSRDLLWISEVRPEPGWWSALRAQHERTGLWPLILDDLSADDPGRPWQDEDDLNPGLVSSAPGDHDAGAVLSRWWAGVQPEEAEFRESVAPFVDGWPGLARPGVPQKDPEEGAAHFADYLVGRSWIHRPRLGLIPSGRGADALTDVGWTGPVNHDNDTAKVSAVLRSWEERFGVRVVGAGFATLYLSVAAPPADLEHALVVAAEHHAFCPDNVQQGCASLAEYAEELIDAPHWTFWWD